MIAFVFISCTFAVAALAQTTVSSGCGTSGPVSCSSSTKRSSLIRDAEASTSSCCVEQQGLLLQTQFWDTDPPTGPDDSWTIHGLWPDNCNGTFEEDCDESRAYTDISGLLTANGASSTLSFMEDFWLNDPNDGSNEELWEHEWETHGTCYSTLEPSCLPAGSAKGLEAVVFFEQVVTLFQTLPTFQWLSDASITPGSKKYESSDVIAALTKGYGFTPTISCSDGVLDGASYYYHLQGSLLDGKFLPIDSPESGTCSGSISYKPKTSSSSSERSTGTGSGNKKRSRSSEKRETAREEAEL